LTGECKSDVHLLFTDIFVYPLIAMYDFKWIEWNLNKIAMHNVGRDEAEDIVNHPLRGYPRRVEGDKRKAWGQTREGAYLQVVYAIEPDDRVFVIHARPLTNNEKNRLRRHRRRST
jgi:hypothetical protein